MPELPHLSGREIVAHWSGLALFKRVVPLHGEVAIGTLHGILKQAKVSAEEFIKVVK